LSDGVAKIGVMDNYTYRAEWSPEAGEYVGTCIELPSRNSRARGDRRPWVVQKLANRKTIPSLDDPFYSDEPANPLR
jgi:hypothetical protein